MKDRLDKKVALGLALTVALLLATGVYWLTEPSRLKGATDKYKLTSAEIYVQECFYCHGNQGLGGLGRNLRATTLDEEGLTRTISRGVTIMPAWAKEEGGTLTPYQIQGLAALILGWDEKVLTEARDLHPFPPAPEPPPYPPPPYAGMKNPFAWGDPKAVAAGELIYERFFCMNCHWPRRTKPYGFSFMSAAFSKGLEQHPDYYFWTISEGRGWWLAMLPCKYILPPTQRWEILNYLWAMGKEYEKVHSY